MLRALLPSHPDLHRKDASFYRGVFHLTKWRRAVKFFRVIEVVHRWLTTEMEAPFVKADICLPRPNLEQRKFIILLKKPWFILLSICTPYQPPWLSSLSKTSPSKTLQGQVSTSWTLSQVILWIYVGEEYGNACGVNMLYTLPEWKYGFHPVPRHVST